MSPRRGLENGLSICGFVTILGMGVLGMGVLGMGVLGMGVLGNAYLIMPDIAAYSIRNGYFPYKAK
ncbi:MAG: hypothetical protein IT273_05240 [Chitinophagales bacterium]|nr:hypothetical protein [Chitinophagales bacterium]